MTSFLSPEAQLAEAQRIARIGSWEWDRATDLVNCSIEMRRMLALDLEREQFTGDEFLERISAACASRVREALTRVEQGADPCVIDHTCSATISTGGRLAEGKRATIRSQATRIVAKARSPAAASSALVFGAMPASNIAE